MLAAANVGPQRLDLGEDPLAQLVARLREREGGVRVQALQAPSGRSPPPAPPTPSSSEAPASGPAAFAGQLPPDPPLLVVGALETRRQQRIGSRRFAPPLDTARRLQPSRARRRGSGRSRSTSSGTARRCGRRAAARSPRAGRTGSARPRDGKRAALSRAGGGELRDRQSLGAMVDARWARLHAAMPLTMKRCSPCLT